MYHVVCVELEMIYLLNLDTLVCSVEGSNSMLKLLQSGIKLDGTVQSYIDEDSIDYNQYDKLEIVSPSFALRLESMLSEYDEDSVLYYSYGDTDKTLRVWFDTDTNMLCDYRVITDKFCCVTSEGFHYVWYDNKMYKFDASFVRTVFLLGERIFLEAYYGVGIVSAKGLPYGDEICTCSRNAFLRKLTLQ